jgi:hypothetical protein
LKITLALALVSYPSLAAAVQQPTTSFENNVLRFLTSMTDDNAKAQNMVGQVLSMEINSGRTEPSDISSVIAESAGFRMLSLEFRGTDALLQMKGLKPSKSRCFDKLLVWFYPVNGKLNLTYSVDSSALCSQPIQSVPVPALKDSN